MKIIMQVENMNCLAIVILWLYVGQLVASDKDDNNSFVATNKWREIRGQGIPSGLHVRINLQTGKKEAKLLDESDQSSRDSNGIKDALSTLPENGSETPVKGSEKHGLKISKKFSDALQSISDDNLGIKYSSEKMEDVKREYKSYKKLRDSYKDMHKDFRTDIEIITQLIGEYRNLSNDQDIALSAPAKTAAQLRILEDFSYMVHQIDNALWFISEGGLEKILLPLVVNETHIGLRVQAMRVLGALTLNNPKAQIKAFEHNFGSHISQILYSSTNTDELSTALYAFGSLLRKFPLAQLRILSTSGIQALIAVLAKECELKVKVKAATIISDVIYEKRLVQETSSESDNLLAAAQYAELNFADWLQSNAFCELFDTLISSKLYELLEQADQMEYLVIALENTQDVCFNFWSLSPQMRHTLLTLKNRYMHSNDEYRVEIAQKIDYLVTMLYKGKAHDEL